MKSLDAFIESMVLRFPEADENVLQVIYDITYSNTENHEMIIQHFSDMRGYYFAKLLHSIFNRGCVIYMINEESDYFGWYDSDDGVVYNVGGVFCINPHNYIDITDTEKLDVESYMPDNIVEFLQKLNQCKIHETEI